MRPARDRLQAFLESRWSPSIQRKCLDICVHYGSCAYDGAFADGHTFEDRRVPVDHDVLSDVDGVTGDASVVRRLSWRINMSVIYYRHIIGHQNAVTDLDPYAGCAKEIMTDMHIVSDSQLSETVRMVQNFYSCMMQDPHAGSEMHTGNSD